MAERPLSSYRRSDSRCVSRQSISARTRRGSSSPTSPTGAVDARAAQHDHAPRRGRRRAPPPPPRPDRARPQRALRLPAQLESLGAERTLLVATSAVRDAENGEAFLGEIEWSYGFATRLLSGEEEARPDAARRRRARSRGRWSSTSAAARPSSSRRACASARPRLGPPDRSASSAPTRRRQRSSTRARRGPRAARRARRGRRRPRRSASPAPSRRSPRSTSASPSTTASACTGTCSTRRGASRRSSSASPRCRSPSAARCPALEPERAPVIVAGAVILPRRSLLRAATRSRSASATSSTAPRSRRRSCPSRTRAPRRRAPTPAVRRRTERRPRIWDRLAGSSRPAARPRPGGAARPRARARRRAGRPRPPARARESCSSSEAERLLELACRASSVKLRRLRDLADRGRLRVEAGRDDLAHERLAGHDDRATGRPVETNTARTSGLEKQLARLLRGRLGLERRAAPAPSPRATCRSRVDPPRLERAGDLADRRDQRGAAAA